MRGIIIKRGTIVTHNSVFKGDIIIENKLIKEIINYSLHPDKSLSGNLSDYIIINAEGLHVFPGIIDDQVHFREPGAVHKATIQSESIAAVLGGVTSFMDMPNNIPQTTTINDIENKFQIAAATSYANYSFYLGATNSNFSEIAQADKTKICGIKVFMGSSTGNMLVDDNKTLEKIFSSNPMLIATHCEDEETIKINTEKYKNLKVDASVHPLIRSREACIKSTQKAIQLAKKYNTRLHILHISTAEEIQMIKDAHNEGFNNITGEICVHYLHLCKEDYKKYGNKIKCNPAIKEKSDMLALQEALKSGIIKVVATDHAPHLLKEKNNEYFKAPGGLPLVQHSFQLMMQLVNKNVLKLQDIAYLMSKGPAENFNIVRRGEIKESYYADIIIANTTLPDTTTTIAPAYKCGWSPFEGQTFDTSIIYTIINGEIIAKDGKITGTRNAIPLEFQR